MTNSKNTKRALLLSAVSVALCVAMFVGGTFAWFTDSATTGVNKIQAGNLKIALEKKDSTGEWVDAGETPLAFVQLDDSDKDILWEPGCTYKLPELRIANKGNLALKFKLLVNGLTGTANAEAEIADLAEVIDVYTGTAKTDVVEENKLGTLRELMSDLDGAAYGVILPKGETLPEGADKTVVVEATKGYNLLFHMQEAAGNEYQDMSLEGLSFTVLATQYTYESDSFNSSYDEGAEWPIIAGNVEELAAVLAAAKPGDTVYVAATFTGAIEVPENLKDVTIVSNGADVNNIVLGENGIDNVTFDGFAFDRTNDNDVTIKLLSDKDIGVVTFKDCSITGKGQKVTDGLSGKNRNTDVIFEGCTFTSVGRPVYDEFGGVKSLTLKNCSFINGASEGMSWVATLQGKVDTILVDGCVFDGRTEGMLKMSGGCDSFTFTNNELNNCGDHPSRGMFEGTPANVTWENNKFNGEDYVNPFGA